MTSSLATTPLHRWHVDHQARMVDFSGWSMPVQYTSIVAEHRATRGAVGLFDISHMGRLRFDGAGAAPFLDRLLTRRVVGLAVGTIRYSLIVNESGGILDDVLVYHLRAPEGTTFHMLVVNAGNRGKIVDWIGRQLPAPDVKFADQTEQTAMIAVQGPRAIAAVDSLVAADLAGMAYYNGEVSDICGQAGLASRTGYTGEDGCELIVPAAAAVEVWERVLAAGTPHGAQAAGLGARDTLRLEAAMPLYGHELSEQIDPYQAGLGFAVHLQGREFIGREALVARKNVPDRPQRVGLELAGRRVPREGFAVRRGGEVVGQVTSGTFSPTLERPIAMAYVRPEAAAVGSELEVDIRGRGQPARVVELPFYRRAGDG